jgi:hypothetical protein
VPSLKEREMTIRKVRCNECANKIKLLGNEVNCQCADSNKVEPLYEVLVCDDYRSIKRK